MSNGLQKIALAGCLLGAGILVRTVLGVAYEKTTGNVPPKNPAGKDVDWSSALLWSVATSVAIGLTRTAIRRVAAEGNDGEPILNEH